MLLSACVWLCLYLAFDLCITLMNLGEISQVVTEARFAYGSIGRLVAILTELHEPYTTIHLLSVRCLPRLHWCI